MRSLARSRANSRNWIFIGVCSRRSPRLQFAGRFARFLRLAKLFVSTPTLLEIATGAILHETSSNLPLLLELTLLVQRGRTCVCNFLVAFSVIFTQYVFYMCVFASIDNKRIESNVVRTNGLIFVKCSTILGSGIRVLRNSTIRMLKYQWKRVMYIFVSKSFYFPWIDKLNWTLSLVCHCILFL